MDEILTKEELAAKLKDGSETTLAVLEKVFDAGDLGSEPDGELAAFCTVWVDPETRTAVFEPVGTHPNHQKRGLGKAVMTEGLRRAGKNLTRDEAARRAASGWAMRSPTGVPARRIRSRRRA